jgi:hypothetical protein
MVPVHTSDDIGGLGGIRQQRQPVAALHLPPGAAIRSGRPATPVTTMISASPSTKVFGCEEVSKVCLEAAPPRQSPSGGEGRPGRTTVVTVTDYSESDSVADSSDESSCVTGALVAITSNTVEGTCDTHTVGIIGTCGNSDVRSGFSCHGRAWLMPTLVGSFRAELSRSR